MLLKFTALVWLFTAQFSQAQFPPKPKNTTILHSRFGDGVYISYKQVGYLLPFMTVHER
jgi:hypothetical protein